MSGAPPAPAVGQEDVARLWVLGRLDRALDQTLRDLIEMAAEEVSIATGDAVTIRALAQDRRTLRPLVAMHPETAWREAMIEAMQTTQRADEGLWRDVIVEGRAARWVLDPAAPPPEATASQRSFLERHPARAILAVPAIDGDGVVVGGLSLVRFSPGRPHGPAEEELLAGVATRIAPLLGLVASIAP